MERCANASLALYVIPVHTGIHGWRKSLDPGVRRDDSCSSKTKEAHVHALGTTDPQTRQAAAAAAPTASRACVSLAIAGSGGSGVMTAGNLLLDAAARAGLYGLMVRTSGPQIRGGEAAALLRLARSEVDSLDDSFDLSARHGLAKREPLCRRNPAARDKPRDRRRGRRRRPEVFSRSGARCVALPLKKLAKAIPGSWPNMVALGLAGGLAGIPDTALEAALRERGHAATSHCRRILLRCVRASPRRSTLDGITRLSAGAAASTARWLISGNEAAGLGAIRGGVRFVAAYPITPATELLEWMAPALAKVGGSLLQAEDELASVNMIIGASYGGVPSLTATAGPGLALMTEAIGLAVSAEVPIVIVDVMRGGPSTGIPAKSEQSDLSFAVSGLPGDAPRLVLAPTSIADCLATTQWAVQLAEALQAPAIVLSDQFMGQSRAIIDRPADAAASLRRGSRSRRTRPTTSAIATPRRASRRWRFPARPAPPTRPTDSSTTKPARRAARRATTACSSTNASASSPCTTTGRAGPTSKRPTRARALPP